MLHELAQLKEEHCVLLGFAFFFFFGSMTVILTNLAIQWRKLRQTELEISFKQELIAYGKSVGEIERLVEAGKPHYQRSITLREVPEPAEPVAADEPLRVETDRERLLRSALNRKFAGVCGGLAHYFGIEPTLVRIAFVLGTVATGFLPGIVFYVILAFLIPSANAISRRPAAALA